MGDTAWLLWAIFGLVAVWMLWFVWKMIFSGSSLHKKVVKLGDMTGMTCREITEHLGKPSVVKAFVTNDTKEYVKNVTWEGGAYLVTIQFDMKTDKIKGIVSEQSIRV